MSPHYWNFSCHVWFSLDLLEWLQVLAEVISWEQPYQKKYAFKNGNCRNLVGQLNVDLV